MPGFWVEVVGTSWMFIFNHGLEDWTSVESDARILAECKKLEPGIEKMRTLMEMLWDNDYYRDVLYHHDYGDMINSDEFSGTKREVAVRKVIQWLEEKKIGNGAINYRLRDWLISRQRYWGAPIPMVYCPACGVVSVPDDQLPVLLPDDIEWRPTGESPLKFHPTWKYVECPDCGEPAERETDTMDTFMCSSWYHLRYLSPDYDLGPFDPEEYDYWMPLDTYTGVIEHATMHLIYTRFFHKAGRDMNVMREPEPMLQLRNQGIILGEDSEKMSKSRGNVIAPDDLVDRYGADTVRAYLMFFARWELGGPWNSSGIEGVVRWLRRVWTLFTEPGSQVVISSDPIHHPHLIQPTSMIILSQGAYDKYVPTLAPGGTLLIDDGLVQLPDDHRTDIKTYGIPATQIATEAGTNRAANTVILGFWAAIIGVVSKDAMRQAVADSVPPKTVDLNLKIFEIGYQQGLSLVNT